MRSNIKKVISAVAVVAIVAAVILGAFSYFTDYAMVSTSVRAGTLDISLSDVTEDLTGGLGIMNPGDSNDFTFTVNNDGEKSADVKTILTVTSSEAMNPDDHEWKITDADGNELRGVLSDDRKTLTYTLDTLVLNGSIETENGVTETSHTYNYKFVMDIDAPDTFQGAIAKIDIEVNAKQHRNTQGFEDSESFPPLSLLSPTILTNLGFDRSNDPNRAQMHPYFYFPVTAGTTLNLTNNSTDFKVALHGLTESFHDKTYVSTDSGWALPGATQSATIADNEVYWYLFFARTDGTAVDINTINLEDFIVTVEGSEDNLLETLRSKVVTYNNSSLKNFDSARLVNLYNNTTVYAHAGGSRVEGQKNTMRAIRNAVENEGFKYVEVDVCVSSDGKFVLNHDGAISGLTIKNTTYAQLKEANSDLATLDECLEYCSERDIPVNLDIKQYVNAATDTATLFSLLEQYAMENKFTFGAVPEAMLNHLPFEYQDMAYIKIDGTTWNDSYIGNSRIYFASAYQNWLSIPHLVNILNAGHKNMLMFDEYSGLFANRLHTVFNATLMYFVESYDLNFYFVLDDLPPDISNITERDVLNNLPQDLWELTGLVVQN